MFGYSGIMISFVFGLFSLAFYQYYGEMEAEELNRLTFVAFMIEGCGEFVGGLAVALFAHKMKRTVLFNFLNSLLFLDCVVGMWRGFELRSQWVIQLCAFFVGFADCFAFSFALAIGGKWNQDGLSSCSFGQSVTVGIFTSSTSGSASPACCWSTSPACCSRPPPPSSTASRSRRRPVRSDLLHTISVIVMADK